MNLKYSSVLDKIGNILFYSLFFISPIIYTRLTYNHFEFIKEIYLLLILGILGLILAIKNTQIRLSKNAVLIILSSLLLILVSFIQQPLYVARREGIYLFAILLGTIVFSQHERNEQIFIILLIAGSIALVIGYLQHFGYLMNWQGKVYIYDKLHRTLIARANYQGHWPVSKPISSLGNENFFSEFLLLFIITSFYLYGRTKKILKTVIFIIALLAIIMLFIISTRATLLAGIITLLFFLWLKLRWSRKFILLFIIGVGVVFFLKSGDIIRDTNIQNRILMYKIGSSLTTHKPILGYGFGLFKYIYPFYQGEYFLKTAEYKDFNVGRAEHTHNEFIQSLVENGVIITSIILLIFFAFFRAAKKQGPEYFILFSLTINSLFSFPFHIVPISIVILYLLVRTGTKKIYKISPAFKALFIILSLFMFFEALRLYLASTNFKRATVFDKIKKAQKAPEDLILANGRYHYRRALTYLKEDFYDNEIRFKYMEFIKGKRAFLKEQLLIGRAAFGLNPNIIATTYKLAKAYYDISDVNRAKYTFRVANSINPREASSYGYLIRLNQRNAHKQRFWYAAGKRYVSNKTELLKAIVDTDNSRLLDDFIEHIYTPQNNEWSLLLARYFAKKGNLTRAAQFYENAIRLSNDLTVYLETANVYMKSGALERAKSVLYLMKRKTSDPKILKEIQKNIEFVNGLITHSK